MSLELFAAYLLACVVFTLVPGPTVTLIVANSLTHGTRAGLLNVAGTQPGLAVFVGVLVIGLASVIETMGVWFDWIRFLGAAYLIWIGIRMFRSTGQARRSGPDARAARRFLPAGLSGDAVEPEGADFLRRLHPAIRRSGGRLCRAGDPARRDRDGDRRRSPTAPMRS